MTTSAPPWTIRSLTERIELGPAGQAETTFTVTNNGPVDKRLVLDIVRSDNAGQAVIDVPKPQQLVPHGGSVSFLVTVTARPGTPPGECWLAARVYSADEAPEESSVLSDRVAFEIKPTTAPPKPKIWIWLIPVLVLVLVVLGVVVFLLLRDDEPPPPPPGPPIHKSGQLVVTQDGPFDLDELTKAEVGEFSGLAPDADVQLFGAAIEAERFFQAAQGIDMGRLPGPVPDTRQACLDLGVGPTFGLNLAEIHVGDVFCVRTSAGRLSVAEVKSKVSASKSSLTMQVTTYE
jgi:hypothetical protein